MPGCAVFGKHRTRRFVSKRCSRGFTLLEIMVAFAIAGLLLAIVPSAMGKALEAVRYQSLVRDVLGGLRSARTQAMLSGKEVHFIVDIDDQYFGIDGRPSQYVPKGLRLGATVAETDPYKRGKGFIRFFPDGSATGGSIGVQRESNGQGVRLRVDWMLGRVSQEPLEVHG